jgi:hypothetical protein
MPHPATSPPADAQQNTAEPPGFDAVYEVDVELLRGCRRPLTRYGAGAGNADEDLWAAGRRGAR